MADKKKKSLFGKPSTEHITRTPQEARAGRTPGVVRYVLVISIALTVVGMGILIALF